MAEAKETKVKGSLEAVQAQFNDRMQAYGDDQWAVKKKEVFEAVWGADYQEPMLTMHTEFPELKEFVYSLVLGAYRLQDLERPGVEQSQRDRYDYRMSMQVEMIINQIVRCRNQKAPCFLTEIIGAMMYDSQAPESMHSVLSNVNKGAHPALSHTKTSLELMMMLRPPPPRNLEITCPPKILRVSLDNNHFRQKMGMEKLDADFLVREAQQIDALTVFEIPLDLEEQAAISKVDFSQGLCDKPFRQTLEPLLDANSYDLTRHKQAIWKRYVSRVLAKEPAMQHSNRPEKPTYIVIQRPIMGVNGSSYDDTVTIKTELKKMMPGADLVEVSSDCVPSSRFRTCKCKQPHEFKEFSMARDGDFHMLGHSAYAIIISNAKPITDPCAKQLGRNAIESHPVNFEGRKYLEHMNLILLI